MKTVKLSKTQQMQMESDKRAVAEAFAADVKAARRISVNLFGSKGNEPDVLLSVAGCLPEAGADKKEITKETDKLFTARDTARVIFGDTVEPGFTFEVWDRLFAADLSTEEHDQAVFDLTLARDTAKDIFGADTTPASILEVWECLFGDGE